MKTNELEAKIFKALGHPLRLNILKELIEGELCVCKLKGSTEFSQANLSQHLKILLEAGLIEKKKDGNFSLYRIKNKKVNKLIKLCEEISIDYIASLYR